MVLFVLPSCRFISPEVDFPPIRLLLRTLIVWGRITVQVVSSLTRLDLTSEAYVLLFVCSEAVESKLVKPVTSHRVLLPPP